MAAIAHLGFGFAAKPLAPEINIGYLLIGSEVLDLLWYGFAAVGLEALPKPDVPGHPPYWEHSLLMATVWSLLFGLLAAWLVRRRDRKLRVGLVFGLVVFSHWVLDFITHPMTAVVPGDAGLPLGFGDSPLIGIGLYRSMTAIWVTEIGFTALGVLIYALTKIRMKRVASTAVHARRVGRWGGTS